MFGARALFPLFANFPYFQQLYVVVLGRSFLGPHGCPSTPCPFLGKKTAKLIRAALKGIDQHYNDHQRAREYVSAVFDTFGDSSDDEVRDRIRSAQRAAEDSRDRRDPHRSAGPGARARPNFEYAGKRDRSRSPTRA